MTTEQINKTLSEEETGELEALMAFVKQEWERLKKQDNTRLQCLEIASKLKTVDGEAMALKELIGKAEALYEFINKK